MELSPHSPMEWRQRRAQRPKEHGVETVASEYCLVGSRMVGAQGGRRRGGEHGRLGPLQCVLHGCAARGMPKASVPGRGWFERERSMAFFFF